MQAPLPLKTSKVFVRYNHYIESNQLCQLLFQNRLVSAILQIFNDLAYVPIIRNQNIILGKVLFVIITYHRIKEQFSDICHSFIAHTTIPHSIKSIVIHKKHYCNLRRLADIDAFQSGHLAEQNGHSETLHNYYWLLHKVDGLITMV